MYEAYFNLQKRPFSATPDAGCFFAPDTIQEILDQLVLRAEAGEGISVVTGAAGTGKTLLCRRVAADLSPRMTPIFLANANFPTRRALLQSILFELGRKYSGLEEQELRLAAFGMLRELALVGRGAVLIVDEAHLLSDRLLEELRLLACLSEEGRPLARLILSGQPALEERLTAPSLEALNQRISCQLFLEPLTRRESIDYIDFRITWAGGRPEQIFEEAAFEAIASAAAGLPRCLNQLCDHALLLTFVQEQTSVSAAIVADALLDLRQLPLQWNTPVSADLPDMTGSRSSTEMIEETAVAVISPAEEFREAPAHAETVCFEVGGDDMESEEIIDERLDVGELAEIHESAAAEDDFSESISLVDNARQVMVAAPRIGSTNILAEEPLDDHYARLDTQMPRLIRTFEDAPVPANWLPMLMSDIPAAPEPPVLPITLDEEYDYQHEFDAADEVIEPAAELDPATQLVDDFTANDSPREYADELESKVLEACHALQAEIGRWHEEEIMVPVKSDRQNLTEQHAVDRIENDIVQPEPAAAYDVIEPVAPTARHPDRDLRREEPVSPSPSGRSIPEPKYRLVFSTLRRRLGRGQ
jgi:type II secretory pathway predicted ATPase ExeA